MKHLFIINPAAGSRDRTAEHLQTITAACKARSLDYDIAVSTAPGEITRIARQAAQRGEPIRIYACGGDGTLNEAVGGAAGCPNASVTVYSSGSGNDFVKIFSDPKAFCSLDRLLDATQEQEFDLIRCGDRLCLNILSVGLDARVAADVARYKRTALLQGFRAYAVSALVNVMKRISEPYTIRLCGQELQGEYTMVCICNGRWYGGGFNPVPEADPADGMLEVLVVRKVSIPKAAAVIGKYKSGGYRDLPDVITHFRTDQVSIHCEWDTAVNLDGEIAMQRDVQVSLAPEKLRFFYPDGLHFQPGK